MFSNPPTSSPCQQCNESGIAFNRASARSTSTPNSAYCSFASANDCSMRCDGTAKGTLLKSFDALKTQTTECTNATQGAQNYVSRPETAASFGETRLLCGPPP